MNKGIYQLVFSRVHHAMVAVAEIASSRAGDGQSRSRCTPATWLALSVLAANILPIPWAVINAFAELPAGIQIRDVINAQGVINDATKITSSSANHISFQQLVPQAIVNYNQLNLAKGQSFNVDMQAGWSMLNRVRSVDPSVINGNVNAAGNIYFLNANGVVIGKDAVFNVGSLYAGTLNITDDLFKSGFVNDAGYTSVFQLVDTIDLSADQASKINNAEVRVETGAQINAAKGGKVMLFAPNVKVEKDAVIKTPDGQTILAAGKTIYLKSSKDPAGMLVEVSAGGTATNLGRIIAERGNITMMGLAVNQMGKLSATTSVRANGSIQLIAQEDVTVANGQATQQRNGIITLGKDSVTEVTPELNDKEEVLASLPFKTSTINLEASLINIDGAISAKGGNVTASTAFDASALLNSPVAQRIHLGKNASIDVSGVDALAPMSRNQLTVQLNSDALKDNPILRGSPLFGKTIFVDARKGTDLFDLKPYIDSSRTATVAEKMTNAGTVTLSNANEIIVEKGANIDVSGGSTTYSAGTVKESLLVFNGKLVPISAAKPSVAYERVADTTTVTDRKWGSTTTYSLGAVNNAVPTYFEGGDAGTVRFVTPIENGFVQKLVLDGDLIGNTKVSTQQLLADAAPKGATLIASALNLNWLNTTRALSPSFAFGDTLAGGDNFVSTIGTQFLSQGFNQINFGNVKNLTLNTAIKLDVNGALTLSRAGDSTVQINQNITAQGANVALNAGLTTIANDVTITTAGTFVNNRAGVAGALTRETAANAGNITTGRLVTGERVKLDASAGAYVDNAGVLHQGEAGDISLITTNLGLSPTLSLSAYGFDHGGALSIQFSQGEQTHLYIGANTPPSGPLDFSVDNAFFSKGGFSSYKLSAFNIDVGQASQTNTSMVTGVAQTMIMQSGFQRTASRDNIFDVARLVTQPDFSRPAVSFEFNTYRVANDLGSLTVHENAHIDTGVGGSIALSAGKQVNVLGDLTAQGGQISLNINDNDTDLPEDPTQMVFIGEKARLSVAGTSITLPDSREGKLNRKIVDAGNITVNSEDSIKGAVVIKQGAVLDVSGSQTQTHTLTNRGFILETLHGDAGSINLYGVGSLLVDGTLSGQASGTGRGGSLGLFFESVPFDFIDPYPNQSGRFLVTNTQQLLTADVQVGDALKDINLPASPTQGRLQNAQISAAQIEAGGFDNVTLASYISNPTNPNNRINFAADLDLSVAGNLRLNSPVLGVLDNGQAKLSSGHLQLFSRQGSIDPSVLTDSTGQLNLNANQIYIDGLVAVTGTNRTILSAAKDIHGQGATTSVQPSTVATPAGLTVAGNLTLKARQIYPDSGALLSFNATGANSRIEVQSSGLAPSNVLSAGGTLSLAADTIIQAGVLKAPFGQIKLDATNQVVLAEGSLTSVSGTGQNIPFGVTISSGEVFNPRSGVSQAPIEKEIAINAPNTQLQAGATLDLTGGGELFAYEWISGGVGGTKDILAQPNTYALIPTVQTEFAATDRLYQSSSADAGIGQTIYLTGVKGVPTGSYTLMPARYALVPGAFIVQKTEASLARGQTATLQDGSALTTGYFADLNTGAKDATWSTFKVIDGSVLRPATGAVSKAPSQYIVTNASSFFADPLKTNGVDVKNTQDAGKLTLQARQLSLDATVQARKLTGADGLVVDISANAIRVVNQADASDTTSLQLQAASLNALNADSILLGGTRQRVNNQTVINTVADSVSIENGAATPLRAQELLMTATQQVSVSANSQLNSGARTNTAPTLQVRTNGDGAFLGLSSLNNINYTREGATPNAVQGNLNIGLGSQLSVGNSLILDGSQNVAFDGDISLASGANVTLGSNRILIGEVPENELGLRVSDQTLTKLGNVSNLTLNSYSTIDTYGSVRFGNDKLNLTLNTAGLSGHLAAGETVAPSNEQVTITADTLTLKNTFDANFVNSGESSGRSLQVNANKLVLEGDRNAVVVNNVLAETDKNTIAGFNSVNFKAQQLNVANRGELVLDVAQSNFEVGRIVTSSGAQYQIGSSGDISTTQGTTTGLAANTNIGGALTLQAANLNVNSQIEALSGQLNLLGTQSLTLGNQAQLSAASQQKTYAGKTSHIDAGQIQLTSGGDITLAQGAVVNVSSRGDADSGKVSLNAVNGNINVQGTLDGRANGTGYGGRLAVDVGNLENISTLDSKATGFSESRSYRVRQGDVNVDGVGAQALTAKQVLVSADQGAINVTGAINANSAKNGSISLYANNDLTIANGASLSANSSQAKAEGGKVTLATANGALNLEAGSTISVAAGAGGQGGNVHLRTPRTGAASGDGVAVTELESQIAGASSVVLEAVRVYNNVTTITTGSGTGSTLGFNTLATDVSNFMANQGTIRDALGKTGDITFHLRAGQEIRANNNLTVGTTAADWNLYSEARTGGEPGVLTLRATNNLNVNGSISDGFVGATSGALVGTGESWSYRLIAGADQSAANVMETLPSTLGADGRSESGNLTLANNKLIRTGTGAIDIATGGDLNLSNAGSVIYTAGQQAGTLNNFTLPIPAQRPTYLENGGDIRIDSKGNINGAEDDTRQAINQWLFRQGGNNQLKDTSWWIRTDQFRQSLAALGGGNVTVNAGGNIANFSVSIPTTARYDNFEAGATGNSVINGGGDLNVTAQGDILSGIYFIGQGAGTIKAGGSISAEEGKLGTVLAMMNGQFDVSAGKDVRIDATVNPTLLSQSLINAPGNDSTIHNSYFSTYGQSAGVRMTSLGGNVNYAANPITLLDASSGLRSGVNGGLSLNPANLDMTAYAGNVTVGQAYLSPSSLGNLQLLANNDVRIGQLLMSDANPTDIFNVNTPTRSTQLLDDLILLSFFNLHANSPLHSNSSSPARVVAVTGNISGNDDSLGLLIIPKETQLVAGQDITSLNIGLQNNNSSDVSVLIAGRDVNTQNVVIGGPGELLVQAGRNVDLIYPLVTSIQATGNTGTSNQLYEFTSAFNANTALPSEGASITMLAGVGSNIRLQSYIDTYIAPTGLGPETIREDATRLTKYKAETAALLLAFMRKFSGDETLTAAQAFTQFSAQSDAVKTVFVNRHLTTELIGSANDFAKAKNHDRGDNALASLYSTQQAGDILLFNTKVSTNSGGSIDMIAPGGLINVGVPGRGGDDIGIITEKGGAIRAVSDGDFSVNQSKVITQFGSDIAIWSTTGTIDAGRGSKTATSVPERIVQTDVFGNTVVEVRGVAAGSGIRAQTYDPDGPNGPQQGPRAGKVILTAPVVDAGEAGIEAGDLQIVAPVVLNAGNIQVQGVSSGVPVAATSSLAGVNAGVSPDAVNAAAQAVAQNVANSAASNAMVKPVLPSIISVDVISIGR